jgi:hypothetical protein
MAEPISDFLRTSCIFLDTRAYHDVQKGKMAAPAAVGWSLLPCWLMRTLRPTVERAMLREFQSQAVSHALLYRGIPAYR